MTSIARRPGWLFGLLFLPIWAAAQDTPPPKKERPPRPTADVRRATSSIQVDGSLDEDAWDDAAVVPIPYEWTPGDNTPAAVETDCLVTFDDENLYIAFRAADPDPSAIRAHLMDRDSIDTFVQDDHVGVMIDTFNDERRAIQLRVNPLGVQADANFADPGGEDWSYDMIWNSAGQITSEGYIVEISMPFNQMRFRASSTPQTWGFEAFRSWPRGVRHRSSSRWSDRNSSCILCQQGHLVGFEGMKPGLNIELDPTLTYSPSATRDEFPLGKLDWEDVSPDEQVFGITGRWGVTPNASLNAAYNPDFSQVEADVAQLAVNTRFALFFPEKRPFFLEGADFFSTPMQAVFTRTVADPAFGGKLTGKFAANGVGLFIAQDEINNLIIPSNQTSELTSIFQDVGSAVARYRRDIGSGSNAGVLYTGREGDGYHNHVYGADTFVRLSPSTTLQGQFLRSETLYPDGLADDFGQTQGNFGGNAFRLNAFHSTDSWSIWANYEDLGKDFRADSGFIPRVDTREGILEVLRVLFADEGHWFTQLSFGPFIQRITDHEGELTDQSLLFEAFYSGPLQSTGAIFAGQLKERFDGVTYTLWRQRTEWSIQPNRHLRLTLFERLGDSIDYANGRPASTVELRPTAELKLGRHVNVKLDHSYQRLKVDGEELFTANLTQLRLVYQFNVRLFARAIFQYFDLSRNVDNYTFDVAPTQRELFTQLLLSYKLNPQTVVFLGYTDNQLGDDMVDLTRMNQSVFLKVGYAWMF